MSNITKFTLDDKEKEALKQMKKALRVLSKRHWFFAQGGTLSIMRVSENGGRAILPEGAMDQDYVVADVGNGFDIDGGDW